ncbi:MAG: hypothetical protein A3E88_01345 [Legionellales bacterium RIFCSPHIGHO2_12_FULL_35_11]|nr:MAG: hypothetical protein A3E88_01345 [Legionellales bacterium RIFCSPHIGHO2_12_FULL_35_11]
MHLFTDYIEPLTQWLHVNPSMALLIAFLVSLAESLAIVGSIIPGSLTMTAIGILAGSGVMRLDLTLIAATAGAIAGDGASYAIGCIYSDQLIQIWPFNKYPNLIRYGKDFFIKHGGKSVVIGRFVGPLRSIIPVIAGIMNMPKLLFLIANFISAVGWALLYVMPGFLIGTASNQLSNEGARRLFGLIFISIFITWLLSIILKKSLRIINTWYSYHLDSIYKWSINHPYLKLIFRSTDNENKQINGFAISLMILWIICFIASVAISLCVFQNTWINSLNAAISFFLQGIRTSYLDTVFIIFNIITSPIPLFCLFSVLIFGTIVFHNWRMLRYLISLIVCSSIIIYLFSIYIDIPNSTNLFQLNIDATFPCISLTFAAALYSLIICYLLEFNRTDISYYLIRLTLIALLILSGASSLYLGDNWFSSVIASYTIGLSIGIMHWILFQRRELSHNKVHILTIIAITTLIVTTTIEFKLNAKSILKGHISIPQQHKLTKNEWWEQKQLLLPVYNNNRMGNRLGVFNIQYLGSIRSLEKKLAEIGWSKKHSSVFYSLVMRLDGKRTDSQLPIMEQLFLNRRPELIMIYHNKINNYLYILRLWRSNYYINDYKNPIWLGSIILAINQNEHIEINNSTKENSGDVSLFNPLFPVIKDFRIIDLPKQNNKTQQNINNKNHKLLLFTSQATNQSLTLSSTQLLFLDLNTSKFTEFFKFARLTTVRQSYILIK